MTFVPNFLYTGVPAIIVSLVILLWAVAIVQRKNSGLWMIGLLIVQLLIGEGSFPP
jgi:hypothetical protein